MTTVESAKVVSTIETVPEVKETPGQSGKIEEEKDATTEAG
jgi:hypothetical protein